MFLHFKRLVKKLLDYCYAVITDSAAITLQYCNLHRY